MLRKKGAFQLLSPPASGPEAVVAGGPLWLG